MEKINIDAIYWRQFIHNLKKSIELEVQINFFLLALLKNTSVFNPGFFLVLKIQKLEFYMKYFDLIFELYIKKDDYPKYLS